MKAADLRDLNVDELQAKLKEVSEELFNLTFQHSRQQLDNTARLGQARKRPGPGQDCSQCQGRDPAVTRKVRYIMENAARHSQDQGRFGGQ